VISELSGFDREFFVWVEQITLETVYSFREFFVQKRAGRALDEAICYRAILLGITSLQFRLEVKIRSFLFGFVFIIIFRITLRNLLR